ncbi:mRNA transport regulator MTR10 KNAG_0B03840 [Huiozyma naganishii CBS 8797]|uniref:Importin N-terminal domain-containing protein n=1 Tax=Huiozyma naganishii (strain ATCC MYA-139 / BCRC 22969 / CBS 8797 / KCTC 17520 / NBRC 10181 / NCYC 3082 / Yp74L-3) TaxID=1071383 RepID=J7R1Y7_HUIN7|nr:hypothetical protein KNAG_0B03840 [Kazachstania naganishii CBS 8797]CCK68825.1 hypothetical protein KNAG_0B03840 [Kazachstania naganishii CBS 8797]
MFSVDTALNFVSSNAARDEKDKALQFLEQFQRSKDAWGQCYGLLENPAENAQLQVFAAQTVRNKVTYDLSQLESPLELSQFKDTLLTLLEKHTNRLVLTQLNVALARLAMQLVQWRDPVREIIQHLNSTPGTLLIFLTVLPEETLGIGSLPITEDEYNSRVHELIEDISEDVLKFLVVCVPNISTTGNPYGNAAQEVRLEQVLRCLTSWALEFPLEQFLAVDPLITLVFDSLLNGATEEAGADTFDAAVECLCVILRESRDTDNENLVLALFQQLMSLQMKLVPNLSQLDKLTIEDAIDLEILEGLTRLFVEAGEAWIMFICRNPPVFKDLVSVLLMLTCKNPDLDIVSYTFPFWFSMKQNLVLARYAESKQFFRPTFVDLINGIISHLQYPDHAFSSKESEDKFKEFRYHMGDVLKDCTAVVGTVDALSQPLGRINQSIQAGNIESQWQSIEAPLFSLRTMAQEVSLTENKILPEIFQLVCNLPEHPKIRYATTLVLGRYTEWTAKHPEHLEMQLNYIFNGFEQVKASSTRDSKQTLDIITASSHALMYFCSDCAALLSGFMDQLVDFYFNVQDILSLDIESQFELCQGLSAVINNQPIDTVALPFTKIMDDNLQKIQTLITQWKFSPSGYNKLIADRIDLMYALLEELKPRFDYPQEGSDPIIPCIAQIWTALKTILIDDNAISDAVIVERSCKFLRRLFEKFHVFCEPLLPSVAEFLVQGYALTGFGSFLWCSGSIIVVFGDEESFPIPPAMRNAVWAFAVSQCETFVINFNKMDTAQLNNYYEIVMDFFSMVSDLIMFYPKEFISATELLGNVVTVAIATVNKLENYDAYLYVLRCLDDIISWGFKTPPISTMAIEVVPDEWRQQIVNEVILKRGVPLVVALFGGLVTVFKESSQSDAIGCIVKCFRLATEANGNDASICSEYISQVTEQLGGVTEQEKNNLNKSVIEGLSGRDYRKVRESLRTFIEWYLRKNISSRME